MGVDGLSMAIHNQNKAVFLDRDGVINRTFVRNGIPSSPYTLAEMEILPGTLDALNALHDAGFLLIVITNQPDVARGKLARETVLDMHHDLMAQGKSIKV